MSLNSPLSEARGLGSAKEGAHHWKVQRLTAIALVPLCFWFICNVVALSGAEHQALISWIRQPWTATLMILFLFSIFYHMVLGLQTVIEDYVHTPWLKISLLIFTQFGSILLGMASIVAVLMIAAGE